MLRLRRLGCTKVQIGYQSLSDAVLAQNKRGHDVAATRRAMRLLRAAGFKIHAHWMPNLLGATPESDVAGLPPHLRRRGLSSRRAQGLSVQPGRERRADALLRERRSGARTNTHELLHVLERVIAETPRYCRLSRIVRDISSEDIVVGNRLSNFREIAERALRRARACAQSTSAAARSSTTRFDAGRAGAARHRVRHLRTAESSSSSSSRPTTASWRSCACRCRSSAPFIDEIAGCALIRELHVYGASLALGARDATRPQHRGLGRAPGRHARAAGARGAGSRAWR